MLTGCASGADVSPIPKEPATAIRLQPGFKLSVFANLPKLTKDIQRLDPRLMAFDADGNLFVSITRRGKVIMLTDIDHDGMADSVVTVADNLNAPHGLTFVGAKLYVANQDSIIVLEKNDGRWPTKAPVTIVKDLPTGGHTYKTLKLGPDGLLYINVGSSCNVCNESDALRATILRYTTEGKPAGAITTLGRHAPSPIYASGLRNTQGFAWHPSTKNMYATNNGADNRSATKNGKANDELPPEHLNQIEANKHYGWPYCWGNQFADPNFEGSPGFCKNTTPPVVTFTSHSTPIGITFLQDSNFAPAYKQDAIVALHGSWNRKEHSGYKLVRVKFENDKPAVVEDFATGWINENEAWGRPVDVTLGPDGALYVSDDRASLIYRITYEK